MTIDRVEIDKTVALLRTAPTDRFIRAMASLELHADAAEILEIKHRLRDRMTAIRPPRRINLVRIFCLPFEDMLKNDVPEGSSWIPRSAIAPAWHIVESQLEPRLLGELKARLESGVPTRAEIHEIGTSLWVGAGLALTSVAMAARAGDSEALAMLGGDTAALAHIEVMAAACQVADCIEELKEIFPLRPFKALGPAQREEVLAELQRLSIEGKVDLRCVVHIVAHWTQNPADVFELCANLDLGPATLIGKALTAAKEKVVVAMLGEQIDTLKSNLKSEDINISDCAELASVAAESLESALSMPGVGRDPEADRAVARMRKELGNMVKDRVVAVAGEALDTLWVGKKGAGAPAVPTLEAVVAAEAAARAIHKCGKVAGKLGVSAEVGKQINSTLTAARNDVEGRIAKLEPGNEESLQATKASIVNATRLLEILDGPERAYEFYQAKQKAVKAKP